MVGLCDLGELFQPNYFYVSIISRLGRKVVFVCVYSWEYNNHQVANMPALIFLPQKA